MERHLSPDLVEFLFQFFSHKTLAEFAKVSKKDATRAHMEAVRRYSGSGPLNVDALTALGGYYFLSRPDVGRLSLKQAAKSRDMDMVLLAVMTGATDYNEGCIRAAKNGCYDIAVELFKNTDVCMSTCLRAAYQGGSRQLINHFIQLEEPEEYNWNEIVPGACKSGRPELLDEVFDFYTHDRAYLLVDAAQDISMVRHLVEKKGVRLVDDDPIIDILTLDHYEAAHYLLDAFPELDTTNIFVQSCKFGLPEFVRRLLPDSSRAIHLGMRAACIYGQVDVILILAEKIRVDWNVALADVCECRGGLHHSILAAVLCLGFGATNVDAIAHSAMKDAFAKFVSLVNEHYGK
jgi:hypothetical protein